MSKQLLLLSKVGATFSMVLVEFSLLFVKGVRLKRMIPRHKAFVDPTCGHITEGLTLSMKMGTGV